MLLHFYVIMNCGDVFFPGCENVLSHKLHLWFVLLLNYRNMYLQISKKWKSYKLHLCFLLPLWSSFMNYLDVLLQTLCMRKWFTTGCTFVIFVAFMNCTNVSLQSSCLSKWFITRLTNVVTGGMLLHSLINLPTTT